MPVTPIIRTTKLVVYEVPSENGTLRVEVVGKGLSLDPATGRIITGTVSKINSFEYSGDVTTGAGRTWDKINLAAADLSVLLGTADWHVPQPASLAYYDMFAALPAATVVTTFTSTSIYAAGGAGVDFLYGTVNGDVMLGGGGNDRLFGGDGGDELHGEAGDDRLFGGGSEDALLGGDGDDRLDGGAGYNTLYGGAGNDGLTNGNDGGTLDGGDGNDVLNSGAGADDLRGGAGDDVLLGGAGQDTMFGDEGNDRLTGGDDDDALYGGIGTDQLAGGLGFDRLEGGDDADRLNGDAGNDELFGGAGNDTINGGDGDDVIHLEGGNDAVSGGAGNDVFIFDADTAGAKLITGFNGTEDVLIFNQFNGDTPTAYQYFLEHAVNVGRNVVFTDGDLTVTFARTQLSAFSLDTFGSQDAGGGGGGGIGGDIIG